MSTPPFDSLVDEHGPVIFRVLARMLGPLDAQDCWQETFLSALRAYPELPPGSNVRGWLVTIAHHKAIDHIRARQRRPQTALLAVDPPAAAQSEPDDQLWANVAALPEKQRLAITYRFVTDLPYRAIGELLGNSEAAARQNVREALRTLRQEIQR